MSPTGTILFLACGPCEPFGVGIANPLSELGSPIKGKSIVLYVGLLPGPPLSNTIEITGNKLRQEQQVQYPIGSQDVGWLTPPQDCYRVNRQC